MCRQTQGRMPEVVDPRNRLNVDTLPEAAARRKNNERLSRTAGWNALNPARHHLASCRAKGRFRLEAPFPRTQRNDRSCSLSRRGNRTAVVRRTVQSRARRLHLLLVRRKRETVRGQPMTTGPRRRRRRWRTVGGWSKAQSLSWGQDAVSVIWAEVHSGPGAEKSPGALLSHANLDAFSNLIIDPDRRKEASQRPDRTVITSS